MTVTLLHGDCLEVMPTLEANSVDAIVCDPPYGLSFMGKHWDHGVPGVAFWEAALRVAKPGAHLLAFGGTRTFHRLTVSIEDAGWEIRDCLMWLYGSGFPKSLDIGKAIDKAAGAEREVIGTKLGQPGYSYADNGRTNKVYGDLHDPVGECALTAPATDAARQWDGWGTSLKPAWEPIIMARKPLTGTVADNVLAWGTGGINVDACRIEGEWTSWRKKDGTISEKNQDSHNIYGSGMGAVRYPEHPQGRWPANLILDEESAALVDEMSGESKSTDRPRNNSHTIGGNGKYNGGVAMVTHGHNDTGGASRFFYCAKSSKRDRDEGLDEPMYKMRDDLTDAQREYVTAELQRLGLA